MRYLWETVLEAQKEKRSLNSIRYVHAPHGSPYMEMALECLNQEELDGKKALEVNTYYRFYSIFKDLYNPMQWEFLSIRESLTNLILHTLAENDVKKGMTREEYYKKMLISDIENGVCGEAVRTVFMGLEREEQEILLGGWLRSYRVGSSLSIFIDMVGDLIEDSIVYHNNDNPDELLIYTGLKYTSAVEQKIRCLMDLFLDMRYQVDIFYEYHFGIIEIEGTMVIDEIAIY